MTNSQNLLDLLTLKIQNIPIEKISDKIILNFIKYRHVFAGYCSKCYRNHMEHQRQKSRPQQMSGFTKFEEKKRQQTDKKNKYLKNLTVFRKSSSAKGKYLWKICISISTACCFVLSKVHESSKILLTNENFQIRNHFILIEKNVWFKMSCCICLFKDKQLNVIYNNHLMTFKLQINIFIFDFLSQFVVFTIKTVIDFFNLFVFISLYSKYH